MADFTYVLRCCDDVFRPEKTDRLFANDDWKSHYQYHDLMRGHCPRCHHKKMAWLGITYTGEIGNYYAVSRKRWPHYMDLLRTSSTVKAQRNGAAVVMSSRQQFPWTPCQVQVK